MYVVAIDSYSNVSLYRIPYKKDDGFILQDKVSLIINLDRIEEPSYNRLMTNKEVNQFIFRFDDGNIQVVDLGNNKKFMIKNGKNSL